MREKNIPRIINSQAEKASEFKLPQILSLPLKLD